MNAPQGLSITRDTAPGADIVRIAGEVDLENAEELEAAALATSAPLVILELEGLSYIDSAGIRAIELGHRRLADEKRSLLIVAPPGTRASQTFRVSGFGRGVVVESLAGALEAAAPRAPSDV